ncbi:prolidase [Legionella beliardensis]|uniref:Prolidase n=1 Tax=Legionella beliardensis TaxID=91822 RepID=A0A378I1E1_9GAMM|nr:amidohydrolase family protein [Legionella beliardensis]STX28540.1 prolidase [Legionella beliardensis]
MSSFVLFKRANLILNDWDELQVGYDVLIKDNKILTVSATPINHDEATVIDVKGMTLMPGLIDSHAHITGLTLSPKNITSSLEEIAHAETLYLKNSLMFGYTTLREAGGANYAIARLLEAGEIIGPRLFYSGMAITQTGGGADFRTPAETTDACGHASTFSVMSVIADGVDAVRKAAREELRKGATQLKLFCSGGVVFPAQHPTIYEFSLDELRAAVEEAQAYNTYVMAHVYSDEGVRRCIKAGIRSIEHANYITEETVALMAEHNLYYNPTFISLVQRVESAESNHLSPVIVENLKKTIAMGKQVYKWAKKYQLKTGFGTDLWGPVAQKEQLREFEMRKDLDSPINIIRSATAVNADLLMQTGKLGVIAPEAYADLLIVKGNPLNDLDLLCKPEENLMLIMKDGVIYKNLLN